jgi:hypothetical protein
MAQAMEDIFGGVTQTMNTLLACYSPEQLAAIEDFIQQATAALEAETMRIRQQAAALTATSDTAARRSG